MNERRAEITGNLRELGAEGPVHKETRRTHGPAPRIDRQVSIRAATPRDSEGLRQMFSRASTETIFRRFRIPYPYVSEQMLAFMLDEERHDRQSLVAVADEEIVGHAMYARLEDSGEAEVAIVVEDGWQSKGVGKLLLSNLAEDARYRGVGTFVSTVLLENRRMLGLFDAVFTDSEHQIAYGAFGFRASLRTHEPEDAGRTPRGAA